MALSADEQDLFDEARAALPHWYYSARANEELGEMAKLHGASLTQIRDWLQRQAYITLADGPTSTTPDWVAQHAVDRGTRRQSGESDAALRDRLRSVQQLLLRQVLLDQVAIILAADGVAGTAYMVELPRDEIYFGTVTAPAGTGGVFSGPSSGVMTFTPTVKFPMPPFKLPAAALDPFTVLSGRVLSYQIIFSGSTSSGNNGTFTTTGLVGNGVKYSNASGVAGTDASTSWTVKRKDWQGVVLDGRRHSFLSRGDRAGRRGAEIVVILPFGTSEATRKTVLEMLRTKKGAGVALRVERRVNP